MSAHTSTAARDPTLSEALLESHLNSGLSGSTFHTDASSSHKLVASITEYVAFPDVALRNSEHMDRDPQLRPLIPSILDALSAGHSDDRLSGELSELLGFDKIELVMEILSHRSDFHVAVGFRVVHLLLPDTLASQLNQRHMRTSGIPSSPLVESH